MALGYHLCLSAKDRRVLAPDVARRRLIVRSILDKTRDLALLAFAISDTHLHLLIAACARALAVATGKRITLGLGRALGVEAGFGTVYAKPVEDQTHLRRAFSYVLRQHQHHGLPGESWPEACSLPDLLGLRPIGRCIARSVEQHLPRLYETRHTLGIPPLALADGPLEWIVEAGCAALALPNPPPRGKARGAVHRAALEIMGRRICNDEKARLLDVNERTLRRITERPLSPMLLWAIRAQLALRNARAAGLVKPPSEAGTRGPAGAAGAGMPG
jgi:hypothetical protein